MFIRDITRKKIDTRYIMSPIDFLNAFFYNEINERDRNLSPQDLFYILEDYLHNCANCQVTPESVLTGKVVLVGFEKGLVKAYYRPQLRLNKIEHVIEEPIINTNEEEEEEEYVSLSELIRILNSGLNDVNEYSEIEDQIIVKSGLDTREYQKMLTKY